HDRQSRIHIPLVARAHETDRVSSGLLPSARDRTTDEAIGARDKQCAGSRQTCYSWRVGNSRTTRPGFPATTEREGTVRVTTLPAPTTERSPISTPFRIDALKPIHVLFPIRIRRRATLCHGLFSRGFSASWR